MSDQLAVRRMVDRLDPDNARLEGWVVFARVADELELCACGTDDEHLLDPRERARHFMEEVVRVIGMIVLGALRMAMNVTGRGAQSLLVDVLGVDVKDASLMLIEPDRDVPIRNHGVRFSLPIT
jgi:hypothetical protein